MKHNDITVVLLLYKTPKKLIRNIINYKDFNLLILDQKNKITKKNILKKKIKNIQYYGLTKKNNGYAKGQNILIKRVKTKFFFSTQADIRITKKSILKLRKQLKKNKNFLLAIPNINNKIRKNNKNPIIVDEMIGAAFLSKTQNFKKFGKFDENFFFYWEDVDLSHRIKNSNYNIIMETTSPAYHLSGKSSINNIRSRYIRGVNFRFGEYIYLLKNQKLRILKIFREIILNLLRFFLNFSLFRYNALEKNIFNLIGIIKFLYVIMFGNLKKK